MQRANANLTKGLSFSFIYLKISKKYNYNIIFKILNLI